MGTRQALRRVLETLGAEKSSSLGNTLHFRTCRLCGCSHICSLVSLGFQRKVAEPHGYAKAHLFLFKNRVLAFLASDYVSAASVGIGRVDG